VIKTMIWAAACALLLSAGPVSAQDDGTPSPDPSVPAVAPTPGWNGMGLPPPELVAPPTEGTYTSPQLNYPAGNQMPTRPPCGDAHGLGGCEPQGLPTPTLVPTHVPYVAPTPVPLPTDAPTPTSGPQPQFNGQAPIKCATGSSELFAGAKYACIYPASSGTDFGSFAIYRSVTDLTVLAYGSATGSQMFEHAYTSDGCAELQAEAAAAGSRLPNGCKADTLTR
jgi:hypothetical protein